MTLASLLVDHPFGDDEPLLHTIDRSLTAGTARAAAQQWADDLRAAGVRPRQAVAVQLPNGPEVISTFVGIWLAGAVFVPINPRAPKPEVDDILSAIAPAAFVTAGRIEARPEPATFDDDVAFVMWTSGTTGRPKPVLHTHTAYLELLDRVLGPLRGGDGSKRPAPNLIPVSLALNAGLYNSLFGFRAGAALVIMDGFETATFAELVRRFEIRSTVLPPAAMAMLSDDPAVTDLSPLKYVRSITAPLSPLQARRFTEKFAGTYVLNGYGQAELGEVIGWTAADAKEHPDKVGAAGRPHKGVGVRIADPNDDGVGALLVKPPQTAHGLDPARVDADGFIDTGDLARVDVEGFVWIEGRAGDVIIRGGNKVFPEHVEEVLLLSPAVREVAVVGVPDDRLGEVPVAFVVLSDPITDDELVTLCREHLVPYKVPAAFHRLDALPRSEVGKVLRRDLVVHLEHGD